MTFHYSMLRFVPDPARGEFVNLGAIVGDDDSGEWDVRILSSLKRARALDEEDRLTTALGFVTELEDRVASLEEDEGEDLTIATLEALAAEMRNVVQLSRPAPVLAHDAAGALDLVFEEMILDPATRRYPFEKKHRALAAARAAYRTHAVPAEAIARKAPVRAGPYETRFDYAVHNGQAVQLVQCWSFQLQNQRELAEQVKSWAWTVAALHDRGGLLRGDDMVEVPVEAGVEVAVVFIPPADDGDSLAFEEAQGAFTDTGVLQLRPEAADVLGEHAATRLGLTRPASR